MQFYYEYFVYYRYEVMDLKLIYQDVKFSFFNRFFFIRFDYRVNQIYFYLDDDIYNDIYNE